MRCFGSDLRDRLRRSSLSASVLVSGSTFLPPGLWAVRMAKGRDQSGDGWFSLVSLRMKRVLRYSGRIMFRVYFSSGSETR